MSKRQTGSQRPRPTGSGRERGGLSERVRDKDRQREKERSREKERQEERKTQNREREVQWDGRRNRERTISQTEHEREGNLRE